VAAWVIRGRSHRNLDVEFVLRYAFLVEISESAFTEGPIPGFQYEGVCYLENSVHALVKSLSMPVRNSKSYWTIPIRDESKFLTEHFGASPRKC
jgi:hypothetical protein